MPYDGGSYDIKVGQNQGISTENMAYGPQNMAYEPPFYAIWTVFIGGGGGLWFVDPFPREALRIWEALWPQRAPH